MPLLALRDIHLSYGHPPLLDGISLSIEETERICLIGRNGEGKSTLLKILSGDIKPDAGELVLRQSARIARLEQEVPKNLSGAVFDVVADGLGDIASLVKGYHEASAALQNDCGEQAMQRLAQAQQALESANGWRLQQLAEQTISRMQLCAGDDFASLSGGMKRRVLLARALVGQPDLLLLDEPTNHLDIESIQWLENFLLNWSGSLVFITHDRGFLRRLASRIVELDRGQISDFPGDYANYQRRRAEMDHAEAQANARFDKRLAQEESWIRQGIKARRTRNEGRVRQLLAMREAYQARRTRQGTAQINTNVGEQSGKLVCEALDVSYAWPGGAEPKPVVRHFSHTILRGDRIGIIGPNGCGKSTLLNLLLGRLQPDSGQINLGTKLEIAYFDQLRDQLDNDKTVLDNVAGGSDKVKINGKEKHVISYLADFLFAAKRCRQPVSALSGGERNRLMLARLFTKPANILILDEPTNDLDMETLELLEELLLEFSGTLLLVSHDRDFLDHVVTSTLVFSGNARVDAYVGGYQDWLRQRPRGTDNNPQSSPAKPVKAKPARKKPKRSYQDQRELSRLPDLIERLETEQTDLHRKLSDQQLFQTEGAAGVHKLSERLQQVETELERAYVRWEALEDSAAAS